MAKGSKVVCSRNAESNAEGGGSPDVSDRQNEDRVSQNGIS